MHANSTWGLTRLKYAVSLSFCGQEYKVAANDSLHTTSFIVRVSNMCIPAQVILEVDAKVRMRLHHRKCLVAQLVVLMFRATRVGDVHYITFTGVKLHLPVMLPCR